MKNAPLLIISFCLLLIAGCLYPDNSIHFQNGFIPAAVQNFRGLNTPFNDMNISAPPSITNDFKLYLSTDRGGRGDFDIYEFNLELYFNQVTGAFSPHGPWQSGGDSFAGQPSIAPINSSADEFGPLLLKLQQSFWRRKTTPDTPAYFHDHAWSEMSTDSSFFLFFASARDTAARGLDLFVTSPFSLRDTGRKTGDGITARKVELLNSPADDCYITFGPGRTVFFCSNRGGNFDIYALTLPAAGPAAMLEYLARPASDAGPAPVAMLNSAYDDKCPFIFDNILFFVSNRPGGSGGFDIYASTFQNGAWTAPQNLGPAVNSARDEYRPLLIGCPGYSNNLLMFSSTRAGGQGGYDIYYTGY